MKNSGGEKKNLAFFFVFLLSRGEMGEEGVKVKVGEKANTASSKK